MKVFGLDATLGEVLEHMHQQEERLTALSFYVSGERTATFVVGRGKEVSGQLNELVQHLVERGEEEGLRTEDIPPVPIEATPQQIEMMDEL
jgi:hypothetical protein